MTMAGAGLALPFCLLLVLPGYAAGSSSSISHILDSVLGHHRAPAQTGVHCPQGWKVHQDSCYRYYAAPLAYNQAQGLCHSHNGHLLEVDSDAENRFATHLMVQSSGKWASQAWLGVTDRQQEGRFVSPSTGRATFFTRWAPGEPNNYMGRENCVSLESVHGYWTDRPCSDSLRVICEKNPHQRAKPATTTQSTTPAPTTTTTTTTTPAPTTTTTTTPSPPPQCNSTWCMVQAAQWKSNMPIG